MIQDLYPAGHEEAVVQAEPTAKAKDMAGSAPDDGARAGGARPWRSARAAGTLPAGGPGVRAQVLEAVRG
ncbi:hypothetical protein ACFYRD_32575 [Streptomyces hirsutus]|uniref:hypothetical protein n=1 Tax=Streptomyces hirsutus TaxID=35620 RepID=UPI0036C173DE